MSQPRPQQHQTIPVPEGRPLRAQDVRDAFPVLDAQPFPILWVERDYRVAWLNRAARHAYGAAGKACYEVTHGYSKPCDQLGEQCAKQKVEKQGRACQMTHVHRCGSDHDFSKVIAVPVAGHGMLMSHISLEEVFVRDGLTGAYTRNFFVRLVRSQLDGLRRKNRPFSVVLLDLDKMKQINDRGGHYAGDLALRGVARAITSHTRVSDSLGRWGGDEFCIFLPSTEERIAYRLVERIRDAVLEVERPRLLASQDLSASFGVHTSRDYDFKRAVARADSALYRAKRLGGGQIAVDGAGFEES